MPKQRLVPMLSYEDGCKAMDWLSRAFGFQEKRRWLDDEGRLTHGELALGNQVVMLASPPGYRSPNTLRDQDPEVVPWLGNPWIYDGVVIMVDSLEDVLKQAESCGGLLLSSVEYGPPGRRARLADLEGHRWFLIERQPDATPRKSQRIEHVGEFCGKFAHDMTNALAPALMSLELLRMQHPSAHERINIVDASLKQGTEMLRQLLIFSKGSRFESELVECVVVLEEVAQLVKHSSPMNIEVRTNFAAGLPAIPGNHDQLHQLLMILCVNAREAMPDCGVLTINAHAITVGANEEKSLPDAAPGKYVVWQVTDTGAGIPSEDLDRIFEPFFTTKQHRKVAGLGLSNLIGILKSHDGFVDVHSILTKGTTFSVFLPDRNTELNG
jgi:signal transduction histidine kinase